MAKLRAKSAFCLAVARSFSAEVILLLTWTKVESPSIIKRTKDIRPRATIKANPEDLRLRKIGIFLGTFFLEKKWKVIMHQKVQLFLESLNKLT
ncbi:MAG: Uncharacterised protein [Puniceicoccaceae bacterium MED-G32]|nr:MAG: Uncharacterised protein [Puniceicoccaceae bacterium MED-G32]